MSKLVHVTNHSDWEALYIDGEMVTDGHLGRVWPNGVLSIIEEYDIEETEMRSITPGTQFPHELSQLDDSDTDG